MTQLKIQKKYSTTYEYLKDLAQQTGVYNNNLASNPDSGLAYINTLADLQLKRTSEGYSEEEKQDAQNKLDNIKNVDTNMLNATDAITRIQLASGAITEDEFKSYFSGGAKGFDREYGSIDAYFSSKQARAFDKLAYDNMSDVQRFMNGVIYVMGEIITAPATMAEGIVDLGGYITAGGAQIAKWLGADVDVKSIREWVKSDFTGAGQIKADLANMRRTQVTWNDQNGAWRIAGMIGNEIGKYLTTAGLGAIGSGLGAVSKVKALGNLGSWIYKGAMIGNLAEDAYKRYGTGDDKILQRTLDVGGSFLIESATELLFDGGFIFKNGLIKLKPQFTAVGRIGQSMVTEGVEEFIAEIAQPIWQNAIENNFEKVNVDAGQLFGDALVAGLVGTIMGGFGETLKIAKTDPSKLGLFKDDVKVSKAAALGLMDTIQNNKGVINNVINNKLSEFADKNGLNKADLEQLNTNYKKGETETLDIKSKDINGNEITKTISKQQLEQYQAAKDADTKAQEDYNIMLYNLSRLYTAIGADAFKQGVELWTDTESKKLQVAKNWYNYLNAVDKNEYSKDVTTAIEEYATVHSDEKTGITPDVPSTFTDRQTKFMAVANKLFKGAKVIFVKHYDNKTKIPTKILKNSQIVRSYKNKSGQEYIFIDSEYFDSESTSEMLKRVAKLEISKRMINNAHGRTANRLKNIVKNNYTDDIDYYTALEQVLTNPEISTKAFLMDKPAVRDISNTIKTLRESEKSEKLKAEYNNILWTFRQNIVRNFPKKARAIALKSLEASLTSEDYDLIFSKEELDMVDNIYAQRVNKPYNELILQRVKEQRKNPYTETGERVINDAKTSKDTELSNIVRRVRDAKRTYNKDMDSNIKDLKNAFNTQQKLLTTKASKSKELSQIYYELEDSPVQIERNETTKEDVNKKIQQYNNLQAELTEIDQKLAENKKTVDKLKQTIKQINDDFNKFLSDEVTAQKEIINTKESKLIKDLAFLESANSKTQESAEVMYDKLINEVSEADDLPFRWGLVTADCAETSVKESEVYDLLKTKLRTDKKIDTTNPEEFLKNSNYSMEFESQLDELYGGTTFLDNLSNFLYENVGVILLPTTGAVVVPINYSEFFDVEYFNDFYNNKSPAEVVDGTKFFKKEFFEKYPKLKDLFKKVYITKNQFYKTDPVTKEQVIDTRKQGAYEIGSNRIKLSTTAKNPSNTLFHEITHYIFDELGLHSPLANDMVRNKIAKSLTDYQLEEFYKIVMDGTRNGNVVLDYYASKEYAENIPYRTWLEQNFIKACYKLDLEETVSRGYKSSKNLIFDSSTGWAVSSGVLITTTGLQGYGQFKNLKISFDDNLSNFLKQYDNSKKPVESTTKLSTTTIKNAQPETSNTNKSEIKKETKQTVDKPKTIKTITSQYSEQLTKLKLGYLVSSNIKNTDDKVTSTLLSPDSASDETKKVLITLKKYLFPNEKNVKNDRLLEALNDKSKFSDSFRTFVSDLAKENTLAINIPIRQQDVRAYANLHFSNLENLKRLPDTEVQFLLEACFNCSSLQLKTGEDVAYWLETGFPAMAALAMSETSEQINWNDLQTIDQIRNYLETKNKELKELTNNEKVYNKINEFKSTDEKYLKLENELSTLQQIDESDITVSNSILKTLGLVTDEELETYKKASSKKQKELDVKKRQSVEKRIENILEDLNTLIRKFLESGTGLVTVDPILSMRVIDIVGNVKASSDRNIYSPLLGRTNNPIKISKDNLRKIVKNLTTTSSYDKIDTTKETSDGETLNVFENQGVEEKGYENVENGTAEKSKELIGLKKFKKQLTKRFSSKKEVLSQIPIIAKYANGEMIVDSKQEDEFHQTPDAKSTEIAGQTALEATPKIVSVFKYGVKLALVTGHFEAKQISNYVSSLFIEALGITDYDAINKIKQIISVCVAKLNLKTEFLENKRQEFKSAVYDNFKKDREVEIQKKYEKTLKTLTDEDSNPTVYVVSKNPTEVNEQILTLKQEQFKKELIESLSKELNIGKAIVKKAFDKVGENAENIQNKKFYEQAVRNELGVGPKDTSAIEEQAVEAQKNAHRRSSRRLAVVRNADIITNNSDKFENTGISPETLEAARNLNDGKPINKKDAEAINEAVEIQTVTEKAEESVRTQKPNDESTSKPKTEKLHTTEEVKKEVTTKVNKWFYEKDGKLKGNFLTQHKYDGTHEAFSGSMIYKVDRDNNGGVIKALITDLQNMYNDNPEHFIQFLWELQNQLYNVKWLPGNDLRAEKQNLFIGDTITQALLDHFFSIITVMRDELNNKFAMSLLDVAAVEAMISGIGLRSKLETSRNQFNINEKDINTIAELMAMGSVENFTKEINKILNKFKELKQQYDEKQAENIKKRTRVKDLQAQREKRQQEIKEYNRKIDALKEVLSKAMSAENRQKAETDLNNAKAELERMNKDLQRIKKQERQLNNQITKEQAELDNEKATANKLERLIADLESKDPKNKARGVAALYQYKEQLPEEAKEAVNKSGLKNLTEDLIKKYGKDLGLIKPGRVLYDRLRRFRYMVMLSSPSTWIRNKIINTGMQGLEALTETISEWRLTQNIATFGIDFDKLNIDGATQTIEVIDEDGKTHSYKFPVMTFDWKRVNLDKYVTDWIESDVLPKEELDKIFGFGGKYGEFKKYKSESVTEITHPENWFDKISDKIGTAEQYMLSDAKKAHPMAKRVFGQLILSNIGQLTEAILTKEAINQGIDRHSEEFKNSSFYKKVISLASNFKNNALNSETFSEFVKLIPKEFIGRFKDAAIKYTQKTYFRNDNWLGKMFNELVENHPLAMIIPSTLIPFARMAYNTMMTVINYSPLGFFSWINQNTTYKKMLKKLDALYEMADKELPKQILQYQKDLSNLYNKLLNTKVSEEGIYSAVSSDLAQYEEAIKNKEQTRLTEQQYKYLKENFDILEAKMVQRQSLLNNDIAKITNSITGFEKINMTRDFSKAVIGTSFYIIGAILAAIGWLRIDDEEDYMGVVLDVAGWKLRLSDFSPLTSSMMFGVATYKVFFPDKDSHKQSELSINTLLTLFLNDTPLDFISDAIEYSDNVAEWGLNILSTLGTQYVPNILKQFSKTFEQTKKVKSSDSWERVWQNIVDTIPWVRNIFLEDKIDPYTGKAVTRGDNPGAGLAIMEMIYFLTGVKAIYRVDSPIEAEVKRLNVQSSGATGRFTYKGKKYNLSKMDPSELTEFKKYRGVYIEDKLTKLINSSKYKRVNDTQKKELIKQVYSKASEYAKKQWLKNNK